VGRLRIRKLVLVWFFFVSLAGEGLYLSDTYLAEVNVFCCCDNPAKGVNTRRSFLVQDDIPECKAVQSLPAVSTLCCKTHSSAFFCEIESIPVKQGHILW
jgi:hypothetical protein